MKLVLYILAFVCLPFTAQAQMTHCSKIGTSVSCQDFEYPGAREEIEKLDKNSWEYRQGTEKLDQERKKRIEAEVEKIQKKEIDDMEAENQRKKDKKNFAKMLGVFKPVKVDKDGFYYD